MMLTAILREPMEKPDRGATGNEPVPASRFWQALLTDALTEAALSYRSSAGARKCRSLSLLSLV